MNVYAIIRHNQLAYCLSDLEHLISIKFVKKTVSVCAQVHTSVVNIRL